MFDCKLFGVKAVLFIIYVANGLQNYIVTTYNN